MLLDNTNLCCNYMLALQQGDVEEVARLRAEVERLAGLLATAEAAGEEAGHLRDIIEAEKESKVLQVCPESSIKCCDMPGLVSLVFRRGCWSCSISESDQVIRRRQASKASWSRVACDTVCHALRNRFPPFVGIGSLRCQLLM